MMGTEHERSDENGKGAVTQVRSGGVPKQSPEDDLFAGRDQYQANDKETLSQPIGCGYLPTMVAGNVAFMRRSGH